MKLFFISLERSADRRVDITRQLNALGLSFEFFRAIDGRAGEHSGFKHYSEDYCLKTWRRPLTPGELGCFASHYLLWKRCAEENEPIVVVEDDARIGKNFGEAIRVAPTLLVSFGYLRLAGTNMVSFRPVVSSAKPPWEIVRFNEGPLGTQCYGISPDGARRFLRFADRWDLPVDHYMDAFWRHGVLSLGLLPFPVSEQPHVRSEISWAGISPSEENRRMVWRPKRFAARKLDDISRIIFNLRNRNLF